MGFLPVILMGGVRTAVDHIPIDATRMFGY